MIMMTKKMMEDSHMSTKMMVMKSLDWINFQIESSTNLKKLSNETQSQTSFKITKFFGMIKMIFWKIQSLLIDQIIHMILSKQIMQFKLVLINKSKQNLKKIKIQTKIRNNKIFRKLILIMMTLMILNKQIRKM